MTFEYKKIGKLQDHLEAEATDWLESYIKDLHAVNDSVELTKEQMDNKALMYICDYPMPKVKDDK